MSERDNIANAGWITIGVVIGVALLIVICCYAMPKRNGAKVGVEFGLSQGEGNRSRPSVSSSKPADGPLKGTIPLIVVKTFDDK